VADVIDFPGVTLHDLPIEKVLQWAGDAELETVVVLGWKKGEAAPDFYFASSIANGPEVLWLLKVAERRIMALGDPDDG
jgi:hypothetical protein